VDVDSFTITAANTSSTAAHAPTSFKMQYSDDGATWVDVKAYTKPAWATAESASFSISALTLSSLTDVNLSTAPTNGQGLVFDGTKWKPGTVGGTVASLGSVGDVDLSGIADGDLIKWNGGSSKWEAYTPTTAASNEFIELSVFAAGVLDNSEVIFSHIVTRDLKLSSGLAGSRAKSIGAATASTVLNIKKNGTNVGTITFAASGSTGTFAMATATSFTGGDILTIVGPATADATLASVSISLLGDLI
jgi:hypothetical protein